MRLLREGMFLLLVALMLAPATFALDVAVPSDFPAFEVTDNDVDNQGYYVSGSATTTPSQEWDRPYTYIFDARGELTWFFAEPTAGFNSSNIHYSNGKIVNAQRSPDRVFMDVVLGPDYVPTDTIPYQNPFYDNVTLKWHEAYVDPDGNYYTVWDDTRIVDMTPYGGMEECEVNHNAIQMWDADHNLLWEWSSADHVDQLPYEARPNQDDLLDDSFNHIHLNSFQVLPDGDILCNGRVPNLVFLVDRETGALEWGLGGWEIEGELSSFEMLTELDLPADVPIGFTRGHDARMGANGTTLTFFDNGTNHQPPYTAQAYARTYELDYDNMTAELTWVYHHPIEFTPQVTGSHRVVEDNKHLIGWGGNGHEVTATEVSHDEQEIVWEIKVYSSPEPEGNLPKTYRWQKLDSFTAAPKPYVSHVLDPETETIELVCNWFGHENEVADYQVYFGEEGSAVFAGTSDTGYFYVQDYDINTTYETYIIARDGDGNILSEASPSLMLNIDALGVGDFHYEALPETMTLAPAWPNPFNNTTSISLNLPAAAPVKLQVFDVLGRQVASLHDGRLSAGKHAFSFTAQNMASGVYFIRATVPGELNAVQKVMLVR